MLFFATLSLMSGVAFVGLALWMRARSRACLGWPSVNGEVIESRIDDAHLEMLKPILRYRYEVAGREHVGFRVAFSGYGVSRPAMEDLIRRYPLGAKVRVYYNPADPGSAVLDRATKSDWAYWLLFGVGFLALAAYLAGRQPVLA